jgi:para-aminobenzoate synthetase component II
LKLLLIDNYDSFTFNLMALLQQLPEVQVQVVKNDNPILLEPIMATHILVSPGPDVPEAAGLLMQCLKNNYRQKSILGVCLGHQALAQLLDNTLYKMPTPQHGMLASINIKTDTKLFANMPSQIMVGLYHSWAIANTANNLEVTATDINNVVMAFQHQTLPLYGVQFHPESYMTNNGLQLLKNWLF